MIIKRPGGFCGEGVGGDIGGGSSVSTQANYPSKEPFFNISVSC